MVLSILRISRLSGFEEFHLHSYKTKLPNMAVGIPTQRLSFDFFNMITVGVCSQPYLSEGITFVKVCRHPVNKMLKHSSWHQVQEEEGGKIPGLWCDSSLLFKGCI